MKITELLEGIGNPVQFYPDLVPITGSHNATVFLCQLCYWTGKERKPDGWIFKSQEEWQLETELSPKEQRVARKLLRERGLIEERYIGIPRRLEYRLAREKLNEAWEMWLPAMRLKELLRDKVKEEAILLAHGIADPDLREVINILRDALSQARSNPQMAETIEKSISDQTALLAKTKRHNKARPNGTARHDQSAQQSIYTETTQEKTHTAALANATPAPHPSVCVASQVKEKNQEVNLDPDIVDHQKQDTAHAPDLNLGTDSAAASELSINTQNLHQRRNTQSASQGKWQCPGSASEKLEFLRWKGSLLVAAGKTSKAEAESHALAWANKHPEEASLAYQGWKRERLVKPTPAPKTPASALTTPNIESMPRSWHEELIKAYQTEGEETFLARESWHGEWLKFAKRYFSQQLKKVTDAS